jgi:hypothetical protein
MIVALWCFFTSRAGHGSPFCVEPFNRSSLMKIIKIVVKSQQPKMEAVTEVPLIDQTSKQPLNMSDAAVLLDFEMMMNRISTARFHISVEEK